MRSNRMRPTAPSEKKRKFPTAAFSARSQLVLTSRTCDESVLSSRAPALKPGDYPMPSPPPSPSERFAKRDSAILRHIALYGVGLSAVVSRLFFGGKQSGHVLKRFASNSG